MSLARCVDLVSEEIGHITRLPAAEVYLMPDVYRYMT